MKRKHYPIILICCALVASVAGANSLDVNAGAAMGPPSSLFGLDVVLVNGTGNQAYVMAGPDKGFNDEAVLNGSFFIGPQGVTISAVAGNNHFQSLAFLDNFGAGGVKLIFFLHRSADTGDWFLTAWHWDSVVGSWVFSGTGFFALYNNPVFAETLIEFEWAAGNPGNLTMYRTLWTGGAPDPSGRIQMMNVALSNSATATINYVFAGMFAGQRPGTFGSLFLDEFVFTR